MGQFLESKAIEKMPNNPNTGRLISQKFCQFVNDCVADTSTIKKKSNFMQNTTASLKAHSLLYIMHQMFKHENRFAQIYDLTHEKSNFLVQEHNSLAQSERNMLDASGRTGSINILQSDV